MPLQNTIFDYLNTLDPESPGITCPSCGTVLGIKRQGSTEMILTENARLELDGYVASYRRYLEKLEQTLAQRNVYYKAYSGNYPYTRELAHYRRNSDVIEFKPGGIYKGIIAESVIDKLIQELDFFEWIEHFYTFPKIYDGDRSLNQDLQMINQKSRDLLVSGFEPRSIAGPLVELIFAQKEVVAWQNQMNKPDKKGLLEEIIEVTCPSISWYLKSLQEIQRNILLEQQPSQIKPMDLNLEEGIKRIQFSIAILFGHHIQLENAFPISLNISPNNPFTLPKKTIVSPKHLRDLLKSEIVLGNTHMGLSRELCIALKRENNISSKDSIEPKEFEDLLIQLRNEIFKFVHFTCTGPASKSLSETQDPVQQANSMTGPVFENTCGWYPKAEETHSVILLGSPGTSKSSVMLTGFTSFYETIPSMGGSITFESPKDEAMMKRLNNDYWAGQMPKPTAKGDRTSIQLSIDFPTTNYARKHFVFTDIAGEVVAKSLTEEGSDPSVLRILKNAETIIFFFDLSIEASIRQNLLAGDDPTWKTMAENFKRVRKQRLIETDQNDDLQSRADINQQQLLKKLLRVLEEQKGKEALKNELNFVCVIPKSDLFASEMQTERFFLTGFFEELKRNNILVMSNRSKGEGSFADLISIGGTSVNLDPQRGNNNVDSQNENLLQNQQRIIRWLSSKALEFLQKIGDALSAETAPPIKVSLAQTLNIGLVKTLQSVFGEEKVYFLPVSAQGKDSETLELGGPPNQKLSEYVFMLPVILSVSDPSDPALPGTKPEPRRFPRFS